MYTKHRFQPFVKRRGAHMRINCVSQSNIVVLCVKLLISPMHDPPHAQNVINLISGDPVLPTCQDVSAVQISRARKYLPVLLFLDQAFSLCQIALFNVSQYSEKGV